VNAVRGAAALPHREIRHDLAKVNLGGVGRLEAHGIRHADSVKVNLGRAEVDS